MISILLCSSDSGPRDSEMSLPVSFFLSLLVLDFCIHDESVR